jgi:putative transposase
VIRDRDKIYGKVFLDRMKAMEINEVLIAPRSPRQNPYAERVIGSIRREYLDHFIIFNERHLYRVLGTYVEYYSNCRTHLSLD